MLSKVKRSKFLLSFFEKTDKKEIEVNGHWLHKRGRQVGIYKLNNKKNKKNKISPAKWTKESYAEYLFSSHWLSFKRAYYKKYLKQCRECGSKLAIQLHHKTYKRIGKEKFEDVIPLCRECHKKEHEKINKKIEAKKFKRINT